jgi:hypothetical protein
MAGGMNKLQSSPLRQQLQLAGPIIHNMIVHNLIVSITLEPLSRLCFVQQSVLTVSEGSDILVGTRQPHEYA